MLHLILWWWFFSIIPGGASKLPEYRKPLEIVNTPDNEVFAMFSTPLKRSLTLSGTFGELRPNHFHAGLDIRSLNRKVGEPVYSAGSGYISRIKISAYGYGRAIYIQHPNGHSTVYGHLDHFTPEIDNYINQEHYKRERFELDLSLAPSTFKVSQGQLIAYMGSSGSSTGPHLHFEIRNSMNEHVLNPLEYGIPLSDNIPPTIYSIKFYGNISGNDVSLMTLPVKIDVNGSFSLNNDTISLNTSIAGVAIKTYDKAFNSSQRLGVYGITLKADDAMLFNFNMKDFSFDEMRYSNAHRDYEEQVKSSQTYHRLYRLAGNKLLIYNESKDEGWINLSNDKIKKINIDVIDFAGNKSSIQFFLKQASGPPPAIPYSDKLITYNQTFSLEENGLRINIPANRLYCNTYFNYLSLPDNEYYSPIYKINDLTTPLHRSYSLAIRANNLPSYLRKKASIGMINGGTISNQGGKWNEDWLETKVTSFGNYTIIVDTIAPTIKPIMFKNDMSKRDYMSFKIADNFSTGGEADELTYNAWVDGKWILMELDSKTDNITHYFDNHIPPGNHTLSIKVTDDKGNSKLFTQSFVR